MTETFEHPAKIRRDHIKYTTMRMGLWLLIGIPFWIFGILMAVRGDGYAGLVFAIVFTVIKTGFEIFFYVGSRDILALAETRIRFDGERLYQLGSDDVILAVIDLKTPFEVSFSFNPLGQPIYAVRQNDTTLRFSSRLDGARRVVCEILEHPAQWPPEVPQPESAATRYHRQADPGKK
jgi:hypothetical protein